jgi:cytochrome c553
MNALSFRLVLASSVLVLIPYAGHAQPAGGTGNGAQIASQGAGGNVPACVGCHGANGEGNPAGNFPRLAGLPRAYFINQLTAYQDGRRANPVMMPIAKGLSRQQIEALAGYYAELNAPAAKSGGAKATAQPSPRAQQLATTGDEKLGVQGCANCHGPGGVGEPPTYPYLAGQPAGYLTAALGEWKNGTRKTDPSMQMNIIAKRLNDSDIAALAAYYSALTPPGPESRRTNMPAGSAARPVPKGQPPSAAPPDQPNAGVEQGQPTTGGNQGPGGGGGTGATSPGKPKGTP